MSINMQIIENKKGEKGTCWARGRHLQFTNFHKPIKLKSEFP